MDFEINKECLMKAIFDFPVWTRIKITANENCIILVGGTYEIFIERIIPLKIDKVKVLEVFEKGSIVLYSQHLSEYVRKSPNNIRFKADGNGLVSLQSDENLTTLCELKTGEYLNVPKIYNTKIIKIKSKDLKELIEQTTFAVSKSEFIPILTGVSMTFKENRLKCVATDNNKLALSEVAIESNVNDTVVVPSTSLNELYKLIKNESGVIHVFIAKNYIVFKKNTLTFFLRLIDGEYPEVSVRFPTGSLTIITMNTNHLLKGVERACIFGDEGNSRINIKIREDNKLLISSNSKIGKMEEILDINADAYRSLDGISIDGISIDGIYMVDAIKNIKEEEIKLCFNVSMEPFRMEPIGNSSYLNLIYPLRPN